MDGETTQFTYDGQNIVNESTGGVNTYYSRGLRLISRRVGANTDYYYTNHHGDVTKLVNSSGAVVADYSYDAFGVEQGESASDPNPFRYCGEYQDLSSGLIYLRARYYDPGVGRFIQEDPSQAGLNWYTYCDGDPVNFWDPEGLDAIWITTGGDSVYGFNHTSLLVQDTRDAKWYYFYWGDSAAYFVEVPWQNGAMSSLDAFNEWNTGMGLRANSTDYTTATFVEGDFNESVDYYKNLVNNTEIRFMGVHEETDSNGNVYYWNEFKNMKYDVRTNNCLHQSFEGFSKGTLYDGTNAGDFMGSLFTIIPNAARKNFQYGFANNKFTRAAARNDVEWELKNGTARTHRRMITQYANSIGIYK